MESIAPKERFYPCPYCDCPVSSELEKCEQCGLEVSGEGIEQLARAEEARTEALKDARVLKNNALIFASFTPFTNFILTANSIFAFPLFELGIITFGIFIWQLIRWHQNHRQNGFEPDVLKDARKEKKAAMTIALTGLAIVALSIWLNL